MKYAVGTSEGEGAPHEVLGLSSMIISSTIMAIVIVGYRLVIDSHKEIQVWFYDCMSSISSGREQRYISQVHPSEPGTM